MSKALKSFLPRSLFARSLLILVLPIVLVQILTTIVFFDRHWNRVTQRLSEALVGEMLMIAEEVERSQLPDSQYFFPDISFRALRYLGIKINFEEGAVLSAQSHVEADFGWEMVVADVLVQQLYKRTDLPFHLLFNFENKKVFLDFQLQTGLLKTSFPQRRIFSSSGYIYLLWVFGSSMLLLVVAIAFMRNQVRPIRKLAAAADRFGRGRDVQFFKPEGAREVRQAGEAFLSMYKRIRRHVEQRTLMLAGVSHDLRTPLTRMRLQLSMLPDGPDVQAMQDDIHDMERMIEGYLNFVRGDGDEKPEIIHLKEFLETSLDRFQHDDIQVTLDCQVDQKILLRPIAMERCLSNLITNAQRYAQHVSFKAFMEDDGRMRLIVSDDGPGIPEDQYDHVFKPFFRVDESRGNAHGSVGLGLSIVMDVVHLHGGRVWLDRSDLGGLAVHMRLPV